MAFRFLLSISMLATTILAWGQVDESALKARQRFLPTPAYHGKKTKTGLDYDVVYHRLSLHIDPRKRDMHGKVMTYVVPKTNTLSQLAFDLSDSMTVDSVLFHNVSMSFNHFKNAVQIPLPASLTQGVIDSIEIHYSGDPTANPSFSYERESGRASSPSPLIWTLSQPYGAREWWPCKQGLVDKIDSLDMEITIPKGNKAAGNGVLTKITEPTDSQLTFHWKHRYPIATYLVATAVTDYVEFTDWVHFSNGDSLAILNYAFPESKPFMEVPVKQTIPLMQLFDSLLGTYPFMGEKYGHAEFLRGGGMEHQTMSFMGSWNFGLIAHELAHQWFGDQVTCRTWSDLWLNEGFATYLTLLGRELLQDKTTWRNEQLGSRERAMREPTESVFVEDTMDVERLFSSHLTYNKGAQLLRMLQWQLGDSLFFLSLRNYLNDHDLTYSFARASDLKFHLENVSEKNLTEFFDDWYYGSGNPHYIVNWEQIGSTISIHIRQTTNSEIDFFEMPVELLLKNKTDSQFVVLEPDDNSYSISLNVDFLVDSVLFDPNLWVLSTSEVHNLTELNAELILYPNPTGNQLHISSFRTTYTGYTIYDATGKKVITTNLNASNGLFHTIDVRGLANGLYFVELTGTDTKSVGKFVKE